VTRNLRFEVVYPHKMESVWQALTDREALAEWLMPNDFRAELGHQFTFRTDPAPGFDGIINCKVIQCEPPRRLAYTWASSNGIDTVVLFALEPFGDAGTKLVLEHNGFAGLRGLLVSFILGAGWRKKLLRTRLPAYLATMTS
jgi:uncharacterized protein YndB with AHSA1/START domain